MRIFNITMQITLICLFSIILGILTSYSAIPVFDIFSSGVTTHADCQDTLHDNQRIMPVIMYHQVLKSRKNRYTVTPETFENDLIELKKRGYTTVLPSEVIDFAARLEDVNTCVNDLNQADFYDPQKATAVRNFLQKNIQSVKSFPQKPIMITFDDGHYNNLSYCRDILDKHGCKAVVNVVGAYAEEASICGDDSKPMYSYLTWQQIAEMANSGIFEIGNHTYDMHRVGTRRGILPKRGEDDGTYRLALTVDILKLQSELDKCGISAKCFAYPFGSFNQQSKQILLDCGFKMIFNCTESRNIIIAGCPESLHELCRFNRNPKLSSAEFFNKMEKSRIK